MSIRFKAMTRGLAIVALTTAAIGIGTGSAYADRRDDHHDEWRRHHRVYYGPQTYVAPPPPVYYAPPPPPAGLNLFFRVR